MNKVALAAAFAACVCLPGAAFSADLSLKDTPEVEYVPPSVLWTGPYFGVHVGGARGKVDVSDTFDYGGDPHADNSLDSNGVIAGVQIGYNFRHGNLVYGVEADLGYMNLSGDDSFDLPAYQGKDINAVSANYSLSGGLYGDLTGRLGYAADKALLYVKGGAAFLKVDTDSHYEGANCTTTALKCGPKNPSTFDFGDSETLWGWTVGVGVEYALSSSLSLKLEYQHFDFDSTSLSYKGTDYFTANHPTYHSTLTGDSGELADRRRGDRRAQLSVQQRRRSAEIRGARGALGAPPARIEGE